MFYDKIKNKTHPGDPVHADNGEHQDSNEGDDADDPDVVGGAVDEDGAVGSEQVLQRLAEAHDVHGDGDRVGQREHEADGAAESWAQGPRNHVVDASRADQPVGADGRHRDGSYHGHNIGQADHQKTLD